MTTKAAGSEPGITYYISGSTSADRIEPVLRRSFGARFAGAMSTAAETRRVDFVWQNAPTISMKRHREAAVVYNHLSNAEILEDKAHLASLQKTIPREQWEQAGVLAGMEVAGREGLEEWCTRQFGGAQAGDGPEGGRWVVKDAGANGAAGVWVIVRGNWRSVLAEVDEGARLAMQQYVERPLLWQGRKVHLRCYALLFGDGAGYLYRLALLHAANKPYTEPDCTAPAFDAEVHITNCCANKQGSEFAGEVIVDLRAGPRVGAGAAADGGHSVASAQKGGISASGGEGWSMYADVFDSVASTLDAHFRAARRFMQVQRSADHFEFIGGSHIHQHYVSVWVAMP
jgi:hypothetical protein